MAFPIIPRLRSGSAGNPSSLGLGELAVNTATGKLYLGADGGVAEIGIPVAAGTTITERTGDGSTVAFTFSGYTSNDDGAYLVSVGGIDQSGSMYTISSAAGGTITFSTAPVAGELISIRAIVAGSGGGGDGNATQIQGRDIASTEPNDGQILAWNAVNNNWEPSGQTAFGEPNASYGGGDGVRIGQLTSANQSGIAIGNAAIANPYNGPLVHDTIAIGNSAIADGNGSIAIGGASNSTNGGIAIGVGAQSGGSLSINAPLLTGGTPSNTFSNVAWMTVVLNGTVYYLPLFQ